MPGSVRLWLYVNMQRGTFSAFSVDPSPAYGKMKNSIKAQIFVLKCNHA